MFEVWKKAAFWRFLGCIMEQQICMNQQEEYGLHHSQFQYAQITRVIRQVLSQSGQLRRITTYETIISMGQMPKGFLAKCYHLLNTEQGGNILRGKQCQEFNCIIDPKTWIYWYTFSMKVTCNVNISLKCIPCGILLQSDWQECLGALVAAEDA